MPCGKVVPFGAGADHRLDALGGDAHLGIAFSKIGIIRNLPPVFLASLSSMYGSV